MSPAWTARDPVSNGLGAGVDQSIKSLAYKQSEFRSLTHILKGLGAVYACHPITWEDRGRRVLELTGQLVYLNL